MGIAYAVMLAGGWWDEMQARQEPGNSDLPAIIAFDRYALLTHLLPVAILVIGIVLGWKRPIWAVGAFGLYALLGVVIAWGEWVYIPLVSGPSLVIALTYWLSMRRQKSA